MFLFSFRLLPLFCIIPSSLHLTFPIAMKAREKSSKTFSNFPDFNTHLSCDEHPLSSHHVGICPHCLNDRLMQLVCSDCGERRLSSCCCSEIEIYRNSCSTADVGSVGRISFLIDNGKVGLKRRSFLRRSSSNRVGVEKSNGFGRIKRLFMKKSNKERIENLGFRDESSEENRKSGFTDILGNENGFGLKRNSCQNPMEFCSRSVFPIKERDSSAMDESGFIELKLESSSYEFCGGRSSRASDHGVGFGYGNENFEAEESLKRNGICENGGSCRITMSERGLKQGSRRNYNIWKRIFKNGQK